MTYHTVILSYLVTCYPLVVSGNMLSYGIIPADNLLSFNLMLSYNKFLTKSCYMYTAFSFLTILFYKILTSD
jgi:hypothetical protein